MERASRLIIFIFICQLFWIWQLLSLIGLMGQKSFQAAHLTMSADAISQFGYFLPTVSLLLHIWTQCSFDTLYSREVHIFEVVQNGLWVNTPLQLPVKSYADVHLFPKQFAVQTHNYLKWPNFIKSTLHDVIGQFKHTPSFAKITHFIRIDTVFCNTLHYNVTCWKATELNDGN